MSRENLQIKDVVALAKNQMLRANPEYQRGVVWSGTQRKKLIDSVLRGYPLPLIYLHHIKTTVASRHREDFEIIDGQQRIRALCDFAEGGYKLFDPVKDDREAKFPSFIKRQPCPWAGKDFRALSEELKSKFLGTELAVAYIETADANEVRDLFVRLQAGLPLNAQETRDALPGQFTDFVLRLGGKPDIARYPGHPFFQRVMGMKPAKDRGKTRQVAAQIAMLFLSRRVSGVDTYTDLNSAAIDDFYYRNIDFDETSDNAQRLLAVLDKLDSLLGGGKHPRLRGHDAIHLVLLVDSLWDEYTRSWESRLPEALDRFSEAFAKSKATRGTQPDEFWVRYGQWTRVNSDRADNIRHRHEFYAAKMLGYLQPLQIKDARRGFGELEREIIYFRDQKKCWVCKGPVDWTEAEAHHVREHGQGGKTDLENGVLVHKHCHPRGTADARAAQGSGIN